MKATFSRCLPEVMQKRHDVLAIMPLLCIQLLVKTLQSLLELVNSTAGINELLLTGKEGMALGANFNSHLAALGGLGRNGFTACALDDALFVLRMDSCLHFLHLALHSDFTYAPL